MNRILQILCSRHLLMLLLLPLSFAVKGQTLEPNYGAPATSLNVANGTAVFKIRINGGSSACAGPQSLTLSLPVGYVYVAGSASISAGLGSVSETSSSANTATLSVTGIPASPDSTIISYSAYAGCGVIGGSANTISYNLDGCAGPATATASVNAQNAQLNITSVTNNAYVGSVGDTYSRVITISNDGLGSIDTLYLNSVNTGGISVTGFVASSGTITATANGYRVVAPTADGHLNSTESITITETVSINTCISGVTDFKSWYGPAGTECSVVSNTATAGATVVTGVPDVIYSVVSNADVKCRPVSNYSIVKFKNSGTGKAFFTELIVGNIANYTAGAKTLSCGDAASYIDTAGAAIQVTYDGGATWTDVSYSVHTWISASSPANTGAPLSLNLGSAITSLDAGDSFQVRFPLYAETPLASCCSTRVQIRRPSVRFAYNNACGSSLTTRNGDGETSSMGVTSESITAVDASVGEPYTLAFKTNIYKHGVTSDWIDNTGFIEYTITMPDALTPYTAPDSNKIGTVSPTTVTWDVLTKKLTLRYPQSAFSIDNFGYSSLTIATMVSDAGCGPVVAVMDVAGKSASCASDVANFGCGIEAEVLIHGCGSCPSGGAINYKPMVARTNYGLYSSTNNGIPGGVLNIANLKLDRMFYGDTIEVITKSKITSGTAGASFNNVFSDVTVSPSDSFISGGAYVYDATGMLVNTIANIPVAISDSKRYVLNAAEGTGAPATFNDGDSVIFVLRFKNSLTGAVFGNYLTNIYASNVVAPTVAERFSCDGNYTATMENIQIATFNGTNSSGVSVSGCGTSTPTGYWQIQTVSPVSGSRSFRHAHFPYEIRPTVDLSVGRVVVNPAVEVTAYSVRLQGQGTSAGTYTYTPTLDSMINDGTNDIYYYNLSGLADAAIGAGVPITEGFYLFFAPTTRPKCATGNYNYGAGASVNYRHKVLNNTSWLWGGMGFNTFSNDGTQAPLSIATPSANKTVNSDSVSWDVQVSNSTIAAKPNTWISEGSGVNGATIYSVEELSGAGGTVVTSATLAGGVYQLGTIPATTSKYFRVNATFTNCVKDSMKLIAGYSCDAYPASVVAAEASCKVQNLPVTVTAQTAALQLAITAQPSATVNLCDVLDYEIEVTNSGLGSAGNLAVRMVMPSTGGIEYVPGSYGIKYPSTTGSYTSLADGGAAIVGGNMVFTIPASELASLPGTGKFKIKFQLKTTPCDFTSGSRLVFRPAGRNGCSAVILGTAVAGNRINLNGVPPDLPAFTLSSSATSVVACGSGSVSSDYKFKLINTGSIATAATDGYRITLPSGWSMNTAVTYSTAPPAGGAYSMSPATGVYDFYTGVGLAVGDSIVFTTTLSADAAAQSCGLTEPIVESGFVEFTATCIDPATTCNSKQLLEPENATTTINVQRPEYSIASIDLDEAATAAGSNVIGSLTLTHDNAVYTAQDVTISVYEDLNSNGTYDAGEPLLGSESYAVGTGASQVIAMNIPTTITTPSTKNLVAVATFECACDTPQVSLLNVVLPIIFSDEKIASKECSVNLSWNYSASDVTVYSFNVERKGAREGNWQAVASIPATQLSYTDEVPSAGQWLYRIKAINSNNEQAYSRILQANTTCDNGSVTVFPNPASTECYIMLEGKDNDKVPYTVTDKLGRVVLSGELSGNSKNKLSLDQLASGIYHIQFVYGNQQYVKAIDVVK